MKHTTVLALALVFIAAACSPTKAEETGKDRAGARTAKLATAAQGDSSCGIGLEIPPDSVVATINGKAVTCSELLARDGAAVQSAETDFSEKVRAIHEQALAELIDDRLLQAAADEAKLPVEKYVAATVSVEPTTIEEMKDFYARALAAGEKLPPFEELQNDLIEFLTQQKQKQALSKFRASLRAAATIEESLPLLLPPQMVVASEGVAKGNPSAAVTIVEFSDFECGFCGKAEATIKRVLETYGDKVQLIYRDFPLPNHERAPKAAEAAHCAKQQGKYWEMHDLLFANQARLSVPDLKAHAKTLELDSTAFDACLDSGAMGPTVLASLEAGAALGVTGTPAFFINGRLVSGAQPFERFKELIDYELAE